MCSSEVTLIKIPQTLDQRVTFYEVVVRQISEHRNRQAFQNEYSL